MKNEFSKQADSNTWKLESKQKQKQEKQISKISDYKFCTVERNVGFFCVFL